VPLRLSPIRRFAIGTVLLVLVGLMVAATALLRTGGVAAQPGTVAAPVEVPANRRADALRASNPTPKGTKDVRAHQLFLRGQYARDRRDREGFETAMSYFDQATALDPGFAAAHVAKAEVLLSEGWMGWRPVAETEETAEAMLTHALSLDPGLASTHGALGLLRWHQWRWGDVERELRRAIALSPDEARWYDQYAVQYCLPQRRFDEALRLLRRAQGLDPLSRVIASHAASTLFYMGRYGEAIAEHRQVLVLEPRFAGSYFGLAQIYAEQKRFDASEEAYRRTLDFWPDQPAVIAAMGHMWGESGQHARAREALARIRQGPDNGAAAYLRANVHMGLGELDLALDALEEALAGRDSHLVWCAIEPDFRALHGLPRFTRILEAVGLPVGQLIP
jgi:adenylate cyclase